MEPEYAPAGLGERVKYGEVFLFAKRKCRACGGAGQYVICPMGGEKRSVLCGCALKRFIAKHRGFIRPWKSELYWKARPEPLPDPEPMPLGIAP